MVYVRLYGEEASWNQDVRKLINISYAGIALLPYVDSDFEQYTNSSLQERRFIIGQSIQKEVFTVGLLKLPQIDINSKAIRTWFADKELKDIVA